MNGPFSALPPESSLWIFGASRELQPGEVPAIEASVKEFLSSWASHQIALDGVGSVIENRFVAIAVDPRQKDASGCSIDKLYQFMGRLGESVGADFLDSASLFWVDGSGVIHRSTRQEFRQLSSAGAVDGSTPVYDLGVTTVADLAHWRRPAGESWHGQLLQVRA